MKKKLKLNDLKVQSFVTADASTVKGGTVASANSCLAFVTCNIVGCVVTQYGEHCLTGGTRLECLA